MEKRIKGFQMAKALNYDKKERKRGYIETKYIKLKYSELGKTKRKTRNFNCN